jgi:hypothetical protein
MQQRGQWTVALARLAPVEEGCGSRLNVARIRGRRSDQHRGRSGGPREHRQALAMARHVVAQEGRGSSFKEEEGVMAGVSGMGTVMIVTVAWDGYHLCADTVSRARTRERIDVERWAP